MTLFSLLLQQPSSNPILGFLPLLVIVAIFYLLVFMPMQKQKKQQQQGTPPEIKQLDKLIDVQKKLLKETFAQARMKESLRDKEDAERALAGKPASEKVFAEAARHAADDGGEPLSDLHASREYRRAMAEVFARRALERAMARATGRERAER